VVLLGSAPLLIAQGLTESLAGRFETLRLPHWSYSEMRGAFGWKIDQYLTFGGYPGAAYRRVLELLDDAKSHGLTLLQGRSVPEGPGYFVPITIVDNPPENSRVVTEEAFGPVLPLLKFSDIDDVVNRANNTPYGLTASVWSNDIERAQAIAPRLETGTVWINQLLTLTPRTPAAGAKQSGIGVESGLAGLLEFTQTKTIYIPTSR
jgi:acyl-CoA reductase-like NAD-dependent aldehyde dehydrogenase